MNLLYDFVILFFYHLFLRGLGLGVVPLLKLFLAKRATCLSVLILPHPVPRLLCTLVPHPVSENNKSLFTLSGSGCGVSASSACLLLHVVGCLSASVTQHVSSLMALTETGCSSCLIITGHELPFFLKD